MIRFTLLWFFVLAVCVYAWKDWYKALCGLILLMAVIEHPDMPKTLLGIQGLNPWNMALANVGAAWAVSRQREGLTWDMPRPVNRFLVLYFGIILVAFLRLLFDRSGLRDETTGSLISEYFINCFKWPIPGLLLFSGCRSRSRFVWGLTAVLALYGVLGLQVIRWVPMSMAMSSGERFENHAQKVLENEVGYHRVNLSMMLAGASWGIFAVRALAKKRFHSALLLLASGMVVYAQALTAGRMGYVTWAVVGFILCLVRWRKYLLFAPVVALVIAFALPGVVERLLQGFSEETQDTNSRLDTGGASEGGPDMYTVTAGRTFAWQFVIPKITEAPLLGFGRLAMQRTGITASLWEQYQENFPHPHNAYLELLLDNGLVGFLVIIPFYLLVLRQGFTLFRDSRSPVFVAIGGVSCAVVLSFLTSSFASQTFYPREGSVGMWCTIGLLLRVAVERSRVLAAGATAVTAKPSEATQPVVNRFHQHLPQARTVKTAKKQEKASTAVKPLDELLWRRAA